jgi:hypothetical protein
MLPLSELKIKDKMQMVKLSLCLTKYRAMNAYQLLN